MKSKRFAQREVDFSSLVPDTNSKALKQAKIEAELKDAIAALKKPNRELAGKSLAETAESRSVSASHPRSELCDIFLCNSMLTMNRIEETSEKSIVPECANFCNSKSQPKDKRFSWFSNVRTAKTGRRH